MEEYISLGHMQVIPRTVQPSFVLPRHGVLREASCTTKLRVVFDGPCKGSNGVSPNDIQRVGPTIQVDLVSILLRFSGHALVVSADVAKMYRCIWVNPSQRITQCILGRKNQHLPVETY